MANPDINIVWVGPPKFSEGGQDVLAVETLNQNFNTFETPIAARNPVVFWCQNEHKKTYEDYFREKEIPITVISIEDELFKMHQLIEGKAEADRNSMDKTCLKVFEYFQQFLTIPEEEKTSLDRVYMKDMIFNFILATKGNYVLDTNIQACQNKAVSFPEHATSMYPLINADEQTTLAEVWMQYAPPSNLDRAKKTLESYTQKYSERFQKVKHNSVEDHILIGSIAASSLNLSDDPRGLPQGPDTAAFKTEPDGLDFTIPALGIKKNYYNAHSETASIGYLGKLHGCAYNDNSELLQYMVEHKAPVDTKMNMQNCNMGFVTTNETPLQVAVRYSNTTSARYLISKGADVNAIYGFEHTEYHKPPIFKSPLMDCRSLEIMTSLLENKADPNLRWPDQTSSPLILALQRKDKAALQLLVKYGADPNMKVNGLDPARVSTSPECAFILQKASFNKFQDSVKKIDAERFSRGVDKTDPYAEPDDNVSRKGYS